MYFPYLRGKQYELLALKELSSLLGENGNVTPIIEPVREPNGSGLDRCISALIDKNVDFSLIVNPGVGALTQKSAVAPQIRDFVNADRVRSANWNLGLIIDERTEVERLFDDYRTSFPRSLRLSLIHKRRFEDLDKLRDQSKDLHREFDVVDGGLRKRNYSGLLATSKGITLSDPFPSQERNVDYLESGESMFSDEHLFYIEDNWFGFSDYLTIGETYTEGGFTPRAVAIHWTYQRDKDGPIMIQHFTSDSNKDTSNVAGKFLEALGKLVVVLDQIDCHTQAAEIFRTHLANDTYPGLGIVKKLSMQNHMELVSTILRR